MNPVSELIASVNLPGTWDCKHMKLSLSKIKRLQIKKYEHRYFQNIEHWLNDVKLNHNQPQVIERQHPLAIEKMSQYMNLKNALQFEMTAKAYAMENAMDPNDCIEYLWYPLNFRESASRFIEDGFNFKVLQYPKLTGTDNKVKMGNAAHLIRNPFRYLPKENMQRGQIFVEFLLCRCLVGKIYEATRQEMLDPAFATRNIILEKEVRGRRVKYNSVINPDQSVVAIFQESHILPEFVIRVRMHGEELNQRSLLESVIWQPTKPLKTDHIILGAFPEPLHGSAKVYMRTIPHPYELQREITGIPHPADWVETESRHGSDDVSLGPTNEPIMAGPPQVHQEHWGMNWLLGLRNNRTRTNDILRASGLRALPSTKPMYHPDHIQSDNLDLLFMVPMSFGENFSTYDQQRTVLMQAISEPVRDHDRLHQLPPLTYHEKLRMMQLIAILKNEIRDRIANEWHKRICYQFIKHPIAIEYIGKIERVLKIDTGHDIKVKAYLFENDAVWEARNVVCDLLPGYPNQKLLIIPIMGNWGILIEDRGFILKEPLPVFQESPVIVQQGSQAGPAPIARRTGPVPLQPLNLSNRASLKSHADDYNRKLMEKLKTLAFANYDESLPTPLLNKSEREQIIQFIEDKKKEYHQAAQVNSVQYLLFHHCPIWKQFETRIKDQCDKIPRSPFTSFGHPRLLEVDFLDHKKMRKYHGSKLNVKIELRKSVFQTKKLFEKNPRRFVIRVSDDFYIDFDDSGFHALDNDIKPDPDFQLENYFYEFVGGMDFLDDAMTGSLPANMHVKAIKGYLDDKWTIPADRRRQFLKIVPLKTEYRQRNHIALHDVPSDLYEIPSDDYAFRLVTPDRWHVIEIPYDQFGVPVPDP